MHKLQKYDYTYNYSKNSHHLPEAYYVHGSLIDGPFILQTI